MKKLIIASIVSFAVFTACNNSSNQDKGGTPLEVASDTASVKFHCPMNCQGDTSYTTAGQCPVCKMDLEKVEVHGDHKH